MANTRRKRDAQSEALALLKVLNITRPPVPVEKIAKHLGARIRFSPLDDEISGMVYVRDGIPIIGINSLHHPNRQRFTIAHEIAHLVLHRDLVAAHVHVDKQFRVLMRDTNAYLGVDSIEIEANRFAAELLMPRFAIERFLNEKSFDLDDEVFLERLSSQFKVSKQAMGYRVSSLLEPLAY